MHSFQLTVEREQSKLCLFNDTKELGVVEWAEERDMGRRLFEAIDELLEKNGLKPEEVQEFRVVCDLPEHSTSRRIAETVQRVYTFGVGFNKKT